MSVTMKAQLGKLFGISLDPLAAPDAISRGQQVFAGQQARPGRGPMQVRLSGLKTLDKLSPLYKSQPEPLGGSLE